MLRAALKAVVLAVLLICAAAPQAAQAADADTLKTEIEAFFHHGLLSTNGQLHWDGADKFDVQASGDTATATLVNARFSFRKDPAEPKPLGTITLDRIEIRRKPAGDNLVEFTIALPAMSTIAGANGVEVTVSLKGGQVTALVENPGERQRSATLTLAGGRIEDKNALNWGSFGPVTAGWKIVRNDDGSWRGPLDFELKRFEFLMAETPLTGTIERIAYGGEAGGRSLAELDAVRDRVAEIREDGQGDPDKKVSGWLSLLPKVLTAFNYSKGYLTVEGITTKKKKSDGEALVTLAKASIEAALAGLDRDNAALRLTIRHDGLAIAPSLVPEVQVPSRIVLDFGLEDIATSALRTLAEAGSQSGPGADAAEKEKAMQRIIGAAMSLSPVFRLYDAAVDFKDVKVDATGEAKRAPPVPIGYAASGDIVVRGFDALSEIVTSQFGRAELPLLKFIGATENAADGAPAVKFHLASAIGHPLTVNGSDLTAWFDHHASGSPGPGQSRTLRLADPPMSGDDVRAVQKPLGPQQGERLTDGLYDTATALAVARFQKQSGLNVDGVVDTATRDKLGIKPPPPPPAPPSPAPPSPPPPSRPADPKN
ncbi:MAG TPA: peptidoglycan-binding domain-containing protein [Stellaceae bacterium]|nr:peptidoglycan-binding domain-containing protein [Stellaceae bacterium]